MNAAKALRRMDGGQGLGLAGISPEAQRGLHAPGAKISPKKAPAPTL